MSNQQQSLQTEREPDTETEIDCPSCYDIMTLTYDFDKFYYFCEECNLSLLIKVKKLPLKNKRKNLKKQLTYLRLLRLVLK
jgi:hypothetical protein